MINRCIVVFFLALLCGCGALPTTQHSSIKVTGPFQARRFIRPQLTASKIPYHLQVSLRQTAEMAHIANSEYRMVAEAKLNLNGQLLKRFYVEQTLRLNQQETLKTSPKTHYVNQLLLSQLASQINWFVVHHTQKQHKNDSKS